MPSKNNRLSGRACEIHCLFLLVVVILIAVNLFLQNEQKKITDSSKSSSSGEREVHLEKRDLTGDQEFIEEDIPGAAPLVPNIHKSFIRRKAPYVRKAKKNRRNKKNKNKKQKPGKSSVKKGANEHGIKKEAGINQKKKFKEIRNDVNKNHAKSSKEHAMK